MRQFQKATLFMSLAALTLTSCSEEMPWSASGEEGTVTLNFSTDGRVMRQTRADDTLSPVVPDGSMFKIDFTKSDNTYSKQWSNVEGFNREKSFSMGDYTLTATYGDLNQEGFDNPYYKGTAEVHVSPGANSEANVVATLANAMVSIRYTDEFKENFKAYSAAVQTEGHDWVMFAQTETRPAYIAPGKGVKLNLTLTDDSDRIVTVQPAGFDAVARHHYVVTIGVKDNPTYGYSTLDIQFDEDVINETVAVPLGDELFTAPAPTITAQDFTVGTPVDKIAYEDLTTNPEFHVFAFGGFKSATLNVISENGYTPMFGSSVELVGADALTMQQLETEGVGGYFRNADKMAVVNLKKFLELLPAGTYTIQLQAVDVMTRTTEPIELKAVITPLSISLAPASNVEFMANSVAVDLTTNSANLKNSVSFKVPNAKNSMVDAAISSVEEVTASAAATRADGMHTYRYVLPIEPSIHSSIDVEMALTSKKNVTASTTVTVNAPEYTITPDAFSKYVVLKIESDNADITKVLVNNLKFYNGTSQIATSNISHDTEKGLIYIKGLAKSTAYNISCSCGDFQKTTSFTTEAETAVPNGDFGAVHESIKISPIDVGGTWRVTLLNTHQNKSSILINEPDGWASVNQNTCYDKSSSINSWFVVPSTIAENGMVRLRTVGYSHNGTPPARTGGAAGTTWYNTSAPSNDQLDKAAGELFLGTYSYDASGEHRVDGIEFTSRPSSLSFDYKYESYNNESGEIYISILDDSDNALVNISEPISNMTSGMINKTIDINAYAFGKKASKLILGFRSTKSGTQPSVNIPSGSALDEGATINNYQNYVTDANQYKALATGSVLTIDNVKLGYEAPSVSSAASKRRR